MPILRCNDDAYGQIWPILIWPHSLHRFFLDTDFFVPPSDRLLPLAFIIMSSSSKVLAPFSVNGKLACTSHERWFPRSKYCCCSLFSYLCRRMMELLRINSCFKVLLLFDVGWVEDFASSFLDLNIPSTVVDEVVSSFLVLKIDIVLLSGLFCCFNDCRLRVIVPPKA